MRKGEENGLLRKIIRDFQELPNIIQGLSRGNEDCRRLTRITEDLNPRITENHP